MTHSPGAEASSFASKLASRSKHVCILVGAGASCAVGLPDVDRLKQQVLVRIEANKAVANKLLADMSLEEGLTHLRKLQTVLRDDDELRGITGDVARALDADICGAVTQCLTATTPDVTPFNDFGSWISSCRYDRPVEIFTLNYDLLVERGLENAQASYFDGFAGHISGAFRPDLVELMPPLPGAIPAYFARLWKLHGSVNWRHETNQDGSRIVERVGGPAPVASAAAIYPSDDKYADSRRVPFVVLMDRFRQSLLDTETVLIVIGYSFGDQHINELIFDAARRSPRSEVIAMCRSVRTVLRAQSVATRNITVYGAAEAIVGGRHAQWSGDGDIEHVWHAGKFLLGNFDSFSAFMSQKGASRG